MQELTGYKHVLKSEIPIDFTLKHHKTLTEFTDVITNGRIY